MLRKITTILMLLTMFSTFSQDKNVINVKNRGIVRVGKNIVTEGELEKNI